MLGPTLRGELISLQAATPEDLPLFCGWLADTEVNRYLSMQNVPSARQEEEWYEHTAGSRSDVHWAVRAEGGTVGVSSLNGIDWTNRHAKSGMFLGDRSVWGRGYASEAVRLRTTFAFNELNLERLESESIAQNIGMHRALEKSGYQKIGRRRHVFYRSGQWLDSYIFELLRDEWQMRQE